jgi:protein SCO1
MKVASPAPEPDAAVRSTTREGRRGVDGLVRVSRAAASQIWAVLRTGERGVVSPRRRSVALWSAAAAALCLIAAWGAVLVHVGPFASGAATSGDATSLQGTDLAGTPAPDFYLQDQTGAVVSLGAFRGRPVVLTFFDSVCPHQDCSLMAQYLNWSAQDMGQQEAGKVAWVALSLNPWRDTPQTATAFVNGHQMVMPLHYLLGTLTQMQPLWTGYHMQSILQPDGIVIHTTGVYVLDGTGRERVFLDEGFDPKVLSADLHLLLSKPDASRTSGVTRAASPATGASVQTQTVGDTVVTLTAVPGAFGSYNFTVSAQTAQAQPIEQASVAIDLTMVDMDMGDYHVAMKPAGPAGPGTYTASGVVSMVGSWKADVQLQLTGASSPVHATFQFTARF